MYCISFLLITTSCQNKYTGKYTRFGEKTNSNTTELLKQNEIPYKVKNRIIHIPEDAFDKAIMCCS
ncbi:hypothetical protein FAY30_25930 (plasmid) [Bacillus sp. S3]|nr:hypothetical protein [Bacillus sp. S3]QCJ45588.1 hypothetical protein FAY30_25930 [Bacillus sp. S3]